MTSVPGGIATEGGVAWGDGGTGVALACVVAAAATVVDEVEAVVDGAGADAGEAVVDGAAVDDVEAVAGAAEVEPGVVVGAATGATLPRAASAADTLVCTDAS